MQKNQQDEVSQKSKKIFRDGKVNCITNLSPHGIKHKYKISNVCKLDVTDRENLQEILKNNEVVFENCKFTYVLVNDFKNLNFENCEFYMFESNKSSTSIKENLKFINCVFCSEFYNVRLCVAEYKNITFENCEFRSSIEISSVQFQNFSFQNCVVFGKFFTNNCIFENANFDNSRFNDFANFSKSTFKGIANFKGCKFGNTINPAKTIDLSEIVFEDNAYFDECEFNYFVAFHTTLFKKTASFYKTNFNVIPNFSPADFQGILNLNNAKWFGKDTEKAFDFETIKDNIKNAYNKNDFLQNIINFRDSFCGIKHALSKRDNLIDASNHRKAELYCREMELYHEIEIDEKDRQKFNNNLKKNR